MTELAMRVEDTAFTETQQRALAIVPKFTASLSIPCSMAIIYEVISDRRKGRGTNSVQRVLVGMSVVDILASSAWFLSTWAVPTDSGWPYAAGNRASCNYQGFLLQIAIGAPLYNSSLALFYILIIKLRWSDEQIWRMERWVHSFILTFTVGTSFLLLSLGQYNQIGAVCWVIGNPPDCENSSYQSGSVPCERGNWAWAYGMALFYGPLWICVIACVSSMAVLYREVRQTVRRATIYTTNYGVGPSLGRSGNNSNKVAVQAILYSLTFLITWMPSTLWSVAHWFQWSHFGLDMAAAVAEPLQGFWNFLIFLRSRPHTRRKILFYLSMAFPCCCDPPMPLNSSVGLGSSRYTHGSNNSTLRNQNDEENDGTRFSRTVNSVKRRLNIFIGSIGGGGSGQFLSETHSGDDLKEKDAIVGNNGMAAHSTVEDTVDNVTNDLCLEDDSCDHTTGKRTLPQESAIPVDCAVIDDVETRTGRSSEVEHVNEQKEATNEIRKETGNTG